MRWSLEKEVFRLLRLDVLYVTKKVQPALKIRIFNKFARLLKMLQTEYRDIPILFDWECGHFVKADLTFLITVIACKRKWEIPYIYKSTCFCVLYLSSFKIFAVKIVDITFMDMQWYDACRVIRVYKRNPKDFVNSSSGQSKVHLKSALM